MSSSPSSQLLSALQRTQRSIVVLDMVESVRLLEQHELDVIERWRGFVAEIVAEVLPPLGGRLVKSLGDGLMLEFADVRPAVQCALQAQARVAAYNRDRDARAAMLLRAGVHTADVVVDKLDVFGAGVNLAARLCALAEPGGIVVSAEVRDHLVPGLDGDLEDLGECHLKHVAQPVRAYRVGGLDGTTPPPLPAAAEPQAPTLAVIPFEGLGLEEPLRIIGDALAGDLTTAFSRVQALRVISHLSARAFAGRAVDPAAVRSTLNADYMLVGSCRGNAERLLIRTELIDARSGELIGSSAVHDSANAILFGQSEAVTGIIDATAAEIASHEVVRAASRDVHNLESYTLLTGAVHLMHRLSRTQFERARVLLQTLVERMPRLASAYGWLAHWHVMRVSQGWSADRQCEARQALDATRRALDVDDHCSIALVIDGLVQMNLLRRFDAAERRFALALQVNPNDSMAWLFKGTLHAFRGEGEQALPAVQRAMQLSPLDPLRYYYESLAATAALAAGRYDDAIELAQRSLRSNRVHASTLRAMAIAQVRAGHVDAARQTVQLVMQLDPELSVRKYLEQTPAGDFETGHLWARSLAEAGVPA